MALEPTALLSTKSSKLAPVPAMLAEQKRPVAFALRTSWNGRAVRLTARPDKFSAVQPSGNDSESLNRLQQIRTMQLL